MTVVGIEKLRSGKTNVLVFDPKYHNVEQISEALQAKGSNAEGWTRFYRRDSSYFAKHARFEMLRCVLLSYIGHWVSIKLTRSLYFI